jgi:hypothetical protein
MTPIGGGDSQVTALLATGAPDAGTHGRHAAVGSLLAASKEQASTCRHPRCWARASCHLR